MKYFHTFKNRGVYDIKIRNLTNFQKVFLNLSLDCLEFISKYYGLHEKTKNARNNGFIFNQINKLTRKFYRNLSSKKYIIFFETSCSKKAYTIF